MRARTIKFKELAQERQKKVMEREMKRREQRLNNEKEK